MENNNNVDDRPFNEPPYGPNRDRRDTDFRRVMGAQMDEMAETLRFCDDDVSMDML